MKSALDWLPVTWIKYEVSFADVNCGPRRLVPEHYRDLYGIRGHQEWEEMKLKMYHGDRLFVFDSPQESWMALAGRMGIALVRGNTIIDAVVVILN